MRKTRPKPPPSLPGLFDTPLIPEKREALEEPGRTPPVCSVSELTAQIKKLLEPAFYEVHVRGEISNLRFQSSGHVYFSLKDAGSQISCVLFRNDVARLGFRPADGLGVVGSGRLAIYEPRGNYQLVLRHLERDGEGRLQAEFERLKRKLAAEGLFNPENKKALPEFPRRVGFVTSPSGAALRDFVSILRRRQWRGHLIVLPARVQGREAAAEISAMLDWAGKAGLFDLLVVGRGGGSLEDLWPFNEESVARAVAACPVPVISAVGHQIDFTLSDFAADLRAETPSAAAELISSGFLNSMRRLAEVQNKLERTLELHLNRRRAVLQPLELRLERQNPRRRLENAYLRLDDLQNRLQALTRQNLHSKRFRLEKTAQSYAYYAPEKRLLELRQRLHQWSQRLQSVSPQSVLNRGFVMLFDEQGKCLTRKEKLAPGQTLQARFADGEATLQHLP
jgi:exodeoxyribonuclease VII large subunit